MQKLVKERGGGGGGMEDIMQDVSAETSEGEREEGGGMEDIMRDMSAETSEGEGVGGGGGGWRILYGT